MGLAWTVPAIAQVRDIGSIEHSDPGELPAPIEAVTQADSVAHRIGTALFGQWRPSRVSA